VNSKSTENSITDNAASPIVSSSLITAVTPTIFIKTEPQEPTITTSALTSQSQLVEGTKITNQVTETCLQSFASSRFSVKQKSTSSSAQSVSDKMPYESASIQRILFNRSDSTSTKMFFQTPKCTKPEQITIPISSPTMPSASLISSRTTNISNNTEKTVFMPKTRLFPKPPYSYSCLIALALKNSTTGSLTVSEIYSFICEHFPYFRIAPNGWKNSVRGNLCLNKGFEKFENPATGSHQRKSLWGVNPAKAHKLYGEVQKCKMGDLPGIKDAMIHPEILESLERGEMKFEPSGSINSSIEDGDDWEFDPLTVDNTTPRTATSQIVKRQPSISSQKYFLLPDSTRTEINLQSNSAKLHELLRMNQIILATVSV
ncbi:unnamed protein product, partial [Meganyctiphanes norvegica]